MRPQSLLGGADVMEDEVPPWCVVQGSYHAVSGGTAGGGLEDAGSRLESDDPSDRDILSRQGGMQCEWWNHCGRSVPACCGSRRIVPE